jgi:hypothetical protein
LPKATRAAWVAGLLAVLALAGWLASRTLIASRPASRPAPAPGTEGGAVPSESAVG